MFIKRSGPTMWVRILCLLSVGTMIGRADEKPPLVKDQKASSQFLRLRRDEKQQPLAFESAIVRYVPQDRNQQTPTVDLITAVHIGEKSYYEQLNREFAGYDAVLYELLAPEGTRIPKGGAKSDSIVSLIQKALKDLLELQFQLEMIDYTRPNMIHADMSPAQFAQSMNKRGESVFSLFMRMFTAAMAQQRSRKRHGLGCTIAYRPVRQESGAGLKTHHGRTVSIHGRNVDRLGWPQRIHAHQ